MDNKKLYIKGIKGKVNKLFLQPQPVCRFFRACLIFCVNEKISFERNPFISKLNGELIEGLPPVPNRHRPSF